jgi:hypothetical protein
MSFPVSPVNGQTTTFDGATFQYNATLRAWSRVNTVAAANNLVVFSTQTTTASGTGAVQVSGGIGISYNLFVGATGGISPSTATVGLVVNSADGLQIPIGTTAQRPANPQFGMIRWNTTLNQLEVYAGAPGSAYGVWSSVPPPPPTPPTYSVNFLIVAGGGGGGGPDYSGGGGGGGGVIYNSTSVIAGQSFPIVIGGGGVGGLYPSVGGVLGGSGTNSSIFGLSAIGGGFGSSDNNNQYLTSGGSGGSGGGGTSVIPNGYNPAVGIGPAGSGTPGQGYSGGTGNPTGPYNFGGGGGGGAGGVGQNSFSSYGSNGGTGTSTTIISTTIAVILGIGQYVTATNSVYFAGGGSGAGAQYTSLGGYGGGGSTPNTGNSGTTGTQFTGGGGGAGGAGGYPSAVVGGSGGSGVVIISYQNTFQRASGGIVTSYISTTTLLTTWIHIFTSSNTFIA